MSRKNLIATGTTGKVQRVGEGKQRPFRTKKRPPDFVREASLSNIEK